MRTVVALGLVLIFAASCTNSEDSRTGIDEPLVVKNGKTKALAQFIAGKLPGSPPLQADAAAPTGSDLDASVPAVLQASISKYLERFVLQGQTNVVIEGMATLDVSSVAFALEGLGTGYWVLPTSSIDTASEKLNWEILTDFGRGISEGIHYLNVVGIGGTGNAGTIQSQKICIAGRLFDGYQGCLPNPKPPAAAISLSWDTNVDLDLQVVAPDGRVIEPKNPLTVDLDAGVTTIPSDAGGIDRDSNASCVTDGVRMEDLVWMSTAPKGRYAIYVNLFDACKQPVVHFNVNVYTSVDNADAGKQLKSWYSQDGMLLDFQANGGASRGLFITEFDFQ